LDFLERQPFLPISRASMRPECMTRRPFSIAVARQGTPSFVVARQRERTGFLPLGFVTISDPSVTPR
jgi:hypothetical protein